LRSNVREARSVNRKREVLDGVYLVSMGLANSFWLREVVSQDGLGVGLVSIFFEHQRDSERLYRPNRLALKPKACKEIRSFLCRHNKLRNDLVPNPTLSARLSTFKFNNLENQPSPCVIGVCFKILSRVYHEPGCSRPFADI
jgi:hypothetical protein